MAPDDCIVHHFGKASFNELAADVHTQIFEPNLKRFEEKWRLKWVPRVSGRATVRSTCNSIRRVHGALQTR